MNALYTTRVTVTNGRNGHVRSEDGQLELELAMPRELGGTGQGTNPEQLFAAGYAACFGSAVMHVARQKRVALADRDVSITAAVSLLSTPEGGFRLKVDLEAALAGVDSQAAEELVPAAHQVCPYSNAVRGNIDVTLSVRTV